MALAIAVLLLLIVLVITATFEALFVVLPFVIAGYYLYWKSGVDDPDDSESS